MNVVFLGVSTEPLNGCIPLMLPWLLGSAVLMLLAWAKAAGRVEKVPRLVPATATLPLERLDMRLHPQPLPASRITRAPPNCSPPRRPAQAPDDQRR